VTLCLMWSVVVFVCSAPTLLYALSKTLPGDNTFGLSQHYLEIGRWGAVVLLVIMLTAVIPITAHWLVQRVTGRVDPLLSCRLQSIARLVLSILVPTAVVLLFDNSCLSVWLYLWSPCADHPGHFDTTVSMQPDVSQLNFDGRTLEKQTAMSTRSISGLIFAMPSKHSSLMNYFLRFDLPYQVTSHSDICDPSWSKDGHCSRAVMAVVGELIYSKLVFLALVAPGVTLLCSLPPVMWVLRSLWQQVRPGVEFVWYQGDTKMTFIMLFVETIFVFGFVAPLLIPLAATGLALNAAVYHCAVHRLDLPVQDNAYPSLRYLYLSRALGVLFVIGFYIENDLSGKLLVCIGMPICVVVAEFVLVYLRRSQKLEGITSRVLLEPLLGPDEGIVRHGAGRGTEIELGIGDQATVKPEGQEVPGLPSHTCNAGGAEGSHLDGQAVS